MSEASYEKILVVDDQQGIRALLRRILTSQGHQVVEIDDGLFVRDNCRLPENITLAIIDMTMPTIDGLTLTRELRAQNPRLPVVLMSGFGADDVQASAQDIRPKLGYLEKPFEIEALLTALVEARTLV